MGWILRALELYQTFVRRPCDTPCPLENLPPSKVRDLLHKVLRETALGRSTHCRSFILSTFVQVKFMCEVNTHPSLTHVC